MDATPPSTPRFLAVCAHPDDESFGLGAILTTLTDAGGVTSVLCFTHGEASTLGALDGDLVNIRAEEFHAAASVLGVGDTRLLDYPDGRLADIPLEQLVDAVDNAATGVSALLVFDKDGITGHPDHQQATKAALTWAQIAGVPVLAWALPHEIAHALNTAFGTAFVGRPAHELHFALPVDRSRQLEAIACHASQATDNPVLWRRLALQGNHEHLHVMSVYSACCVKHRVGRWLQSTAGTEKTDSNG